METQESYRKRCRRYDMPGHAHYLTFSCFRRQPFFRSRQGPRWFLESLAQARRECGFDLWAWVIMPEHAHLLILPASETRISDILWRIKRRVTHLALRHLEANAPAFVERQMTDRQPNGTVARRFWQRGGGYDRNIVKASDLREKVWCIHANPVRRGLVEQPSQWPWSSWRAWTDGVDEPLPIDRDTFPTT